MDNLLLKSHLMERLRTDDVIKSLDRREIRRIETAEIRVKPRAESARKLLRFLSHYTHGRKIKRRVALFMGFSAQMVAVRERAPSDTSAFSNAREPPVIFRIAKLTLSERVRESKGGKMHRNYSRGRISPARKTKGN